MTNIQHTIKKTDKRYFFEVKLSGMYNGEGSIHAKDVDENLHVALPQQFGGRGKRWSPEHLFLSAISSCYMTTLTALAQKMKIEISGFTCSAIGEIEAVEGRLKFTAINIYPKIYFAHSEDRERVNELALKTKKHCLIGNSVNADLIYHTEILLEKQLVAEEATAE